MKLRIATWNINSVRKRIESVEKFIKEYDIDILCLQEIKVHDDSFPMKDIKAMGFEHVAINGQKAYHGVATFSKIPFSKVDKIEFCKKGDARHIATSFMTPSNGEVTIHNFYVPAGGDVADVEENEKFKHKMDFLTEMTDMFKAQDNDTSQILVGDLNIAPHENDVWSHKQLLKVVSHTPIEVEKLKQVQDSLNWQDMVREHVPTSERLYSWWSYRSKDWKQSNKGRRLDHIWVSQPLSDKHTNMEIILEPRSWESPSDHAPIVADFDFS
ncbi:MAG: exodeoxyribonuclease III [Rhizobiales bacterium]|nr:exodeoxyribonuclease III [Hyphomicrobiales bacterium]